MRRCGPMAWVGLCLLPFLGSSASQGQPTVEAEEGVLQGLAVATEVDGFSGTGYVRGGVGPQNELRLRVPIEQEGLYDVWLRYLSPAAVARYRLEVGDVGEPGFLPPTEPGAWNEANAGRVWFEAGEPEVRLVLDAGPCAVDQLRLGLVEQAPVVAPEGGLCDPQATASAVALYSWLKSIYGSRTLAGQQLGSSEELARIRQVAGVQPALRGYELMDYCPSRRAQGADPGRTVEEAVEWGRRGGLVLISWHWSAPLLPEETTETQEEDQGLRLGPTSFDLNAALGDSAGETTGLLLRDIDVIASELRKLADAGVPVLWRPLPEAPRGPYWWGGSGAEAYKALWRLVFDRLTGRHGLHNLVWVLSNGPDALAWYPGDDVVDILGYDPENSGEPDSGVDSFAWARMLGETAGSKMLAMTDSGIMPDPNLMAQLGVHWLWFCARAGIMTEANKAAEQRLRATLRHEATITYDELPGLGWLPPL